jgi:hypothetical protein
MLRKCRHCQDDFNPNSPEKKLIGGYIDECPDCVEEMGGDKSPPKYLGVAAGNGKMSDISILSFQSEGDREAYSKMWRNNSGQNKGKSCQLGRHLSATSGYKFQLVAENKANDNHKGKT